ncbi:MAG: hypothetical protein LC785_08015 [Acidobacteria bacterium]|nr:hypothetical protein [Acidobacteriota bacterium]MCA1641879.1 hypothetical protein [Acidobacteriota bacterium]
MNFKARHCNIKIKYLIYRNYLWLFALLIPIASAAAIFLYWVRYDWKISFTIVGGAVSFIYFIQKQQLEETKLFKELFVTFNCSYNDKNEKLNLIKKKPKLDPPDIAELYDYFNLCSEEYLFYRTGYIYPEVWKAWCNGMLDYLKNDEIKNLWEQEEELSKSYYGLTLSEIKQGSKLKI